MRNVPKALCSEGSMFLMPMVLRPIDCTDNNVFFARTGKHSWTVSFLPTIIATGIVLTIIALTIISPEIIYLSIISPKIIIVITIIALMIIAQTNIALTTYRLKTFVIQ